MMRLLERLWRNRGLDRRLDAELRDHLARDVAARIAAGLDPAEAHRRAQLALGGLEQVREACRDVRRPRLLAELAQDLTFTLRLFRRQPLVGSAIILIIGLAIGANAAIFAVVDAVALRPLAVAQPDELAMLWKAPIGGEPISGVAPANARELPARLRTITSAASMTMTAVVLQSRLDSERVFGMRVSAGFFRTLGVAPAIGRSFLDSEDAFGAEPVAVISHALWQRRFGGASDILGRALETPTVRYRVVGVMAPSFHFPEILGTKSRPQIWTPLRFSPREASMRGPGYMFVLLRRDAARSWPVVQQELDAVSREYAASEPRAFGGRHLRAVPLPEQVVGRLRPLLFALWGAVGCVLLMACANVANLLLSRAAARQRELALRASLGASRGRLLRQLLTESLVLSTVASVIGLTLSWLLVRAGAASLGDALPRAAEIAVDWRVGLATASMAIVTAVLVGALPALQLTAIDAPDTLRAASHDRTATVRWSGVRAALLVTQITIAVLLTASAVLLVRSFAAVQRVDLGFAPHGLLSFDVSLPDGYDRDAVTAFYQRLIDRLAELPQVGAVGAVSTLPLSGGEFSWTFEVRDQPAPPGAALEKADVRFITPGTLRALGVAVRAGREFERTDRRDGEPVAIVSESFAGRTWPGADPIDRHVKLAGPLDMFPWMRVVGVVDDVHLDSAEQTPGPTIYRPQAQHGWNGMNLVVRTTAAPETATPAIRALMQSIDARAALLDPREFSYYLERSVARRRLVTQLIGGFAAVATTLALVGVYALFAYLITLRTREIGIRLTLGARGPQVVWMVMRQALALTSLGLLLGVAAALGARRVIEAQVFGVSASDPATLAGVTAGVLLAAAAASYLPARRAARIELTAALRPE
jgi:putative ABC transport system permease protein